MKGIVTLRTWSGCKMYFDHVKDDFAEEFKKVFHIHTRLEHSGNIVRMDLPYKHIGASRCV